ncbi:MAG: hypothetical protein IPH13_04490 [Planctomycetes bacterium]|nr:hypothetical protein [Planctomycetota bacterium]MCC7171002.1 hypothetical protein [Planctomycetota bacterium]
MNCERFRSHIGQAARVPDAADLDAMSARHAAECAACASWLAEQRRIDAMLDLLPTLEPSLGFTQRVLSRALASESPWHRVQRSRALRAAAVVLVLAGICGVWFANRSDPQDALVSQAEEPSAELLAEMDLLLDWDVLDQKGAALDVAADADVAIALAQFDVIENGG